MTALIAPDTSAPSHHYAISRWQSKDGFEYWCVDIRRNGKRYHKSFYDIRRGGTEKALADAIAWRDEQLARVKALGVRDFCQVVRTTNRSGVPGVFFIRSTGQPQGAWHAVLWLPSRRQLKRSFAVKKYGEHEAFRLAVAARQELLERMDDRALVHHPEAKALCAELAAKAKPPVANTRTNNDCS